MSGVIGVNVWLTLASYLATHCEPNGLCIGRRVAEGSAISPIGRLGSSLPMSTMMAWWDAACKSTSCTHIVVVPQIVQRNGGRS